MKSKINEPVSKKMSLTNIERYLLKMYNIEVDRIIYEKEDKYLYMDIILKNSQILYLYPMDDDQNEIIYILSDDDDKIWNQFNILEAKFFDPTIMNFSAGEYIYKMRKLLKHLSPLTVSSTVVYNVIKDSIQEIASNILGEEKGLDIFQYFTIDEFLVNFYYSKN